MSDQVRRTGAELRVTVDPRTVEVTADMAATASMRVGLTAGAPVDVVVEPLGPHAAWCEVRPSRLHVGSDGEAHADIAVTVPDGPSAPSGPIVVGLRAVASVPGVLPHVGELRIVVPTVSAMRLDIVPPVQRVSGRARFAAVVRNDGASPLRVRLVVGEVGPEVLTRVRPSTVHVQPRGRARASITVWSAAPWSGDEPEHTFTVRADAGGGEIEALGSFVQRTRAGTALLTIGGMLVVVALALAALLVGTLI